LHAYAHDIIELLLLCEGEGRPCKEATRTLSALCVLTKVDVSIYSGNHTKHINASGENAEFELQVTMAVVEGSYHLSRGWGSSLSSVGSASLKCSVLEYGQVYSTVRCVAGNVF
jgi:hypothetical protein